MYPVELVSFHPWDQINAPNVQERNPKDKKVMIHAVVDTAINLFFVIQY